jgi:hypothetical protein
MVGQRYQVILEADIHSALPLRKTGYPELASSTELGRRLKDSVGTTSTFVRLARKVLFERSGLPT